MMKQKNLSVKMEVKACHNRERSLIWAMLMFVVIVAGCYVLNSVIRMQRRNWGGEVRYFFVVVEFCGQGLKDWIAGEGLDFLMLLSFDSSISSYSIVCNVGKQIHVDEKYGQLRQLVLIFGFLVELKLYIKLDCISMKRKFSLNCNCN